MIEVAGLDPGRAAEVITAGKQGPGRRGSGYRVTNGLVLTAAHVLTGAVDIRVRFDADQPGEWIAVAEPAWSRPDLDVALLRIVESSATPPGSAPAVEPVRFGRVTRPPVPCEALGFPLFKLRADQRQPGADSDSTWYRDSCHATGTATTWSNRREGTLEVDVRAPERDPDPGRSPWEGMSGAAVFSNGLLVGVVGAHHRNDGNGTLAAYRVDHWYEHLSGEEAGRLAEWIGLPATPDGLTPVAAPQHPRAEGVPRQLPRTTAAFTGRERELAQLTGLADTARSASSAGTVVISAIDGMAGIGKTALAVHVGHALAERFPDGQLFLDLHGYTQGMAPRDSGDALAVILQAYGIPPQQIPMDLDARAALYRDRLAGSRTLILLDNAATETQVRPLLPGDGKCLVLITSRRRLKGLDDAYPLPLDLLPESDAIALFRKVAGPDRTEADDPALEQVVALCGRLPIALRIAAALIRNSRTWTLGRLTGTLRERRPGRELKGFSDGDRSLTAVFDLSHESLAEDQRRLLRALGLVPGPDTDAYAAAALLGTDPDDADLLLQDLVDHNLLAEPAVGRYRMHDLVRRYTRNLAADDPSDQRRFATDRLLDYYQHTAARADALISRHTRPESARPAQAPAHVPAWTDPEAARAWLRAERANLEACLELAADRGWSGRTVAFSAGLATLLRTDGPWPQALSLHSTAAAAADSLDDRLGQAGALAELGEVCRLAGDYPAAMRHLHAALRLYRDLGERRGQANALTELGAAQLLTGDYEGATRDLGESLEWFGQLGDRLGQAGALTELGEVCRLTGDYPGAMRQLHAAHLLYRELGERRGQAGTLTYLGAARRATGDYAGGAEDLSAALELLRALGDRRGRANALTELAAVRRATGDHQGAMRDLEEALEICRDLGARLGQSDALTELGEVRRLTGDYEGAVRDLEEALALCREIGSRGSEAWALNRYAAVLATTGDPGGALVMYRDALRLTQAVRQPNDEAFALEGIGECLLLQAEPEEGSAHLHRALEIFRRLGMRPDAERVQARLAETSTP